MRTLKILDWPAQRFNSESHPLHKWRTGLRESGILLEFFDDHRNEKLRNSDFLLIHSRYFSAGWQDIHQRNAENEQELLLFLSEVKRSTGKLIWFDAADSSGSFDFLLMDFVDVFLKKQLLKDRSYYTTTSQQNNLRIWLNDYPENTKTYAFEPCPKAHLSKLKLAWNIGLNDYRYFGFKTARLSNYLSYYLYPLPFSPVKKARPIDLSFRGKLPRHQSDQDPEGALSLQRQQVFRLLAEIDLMKSGVGKLTKSRYWEEMRKSKISVSPYGWGEICYRDFETFIAGAILVKPAMEHLQTYPDLYLPGETYVPLRWDMADLEEQIYLIKDQYPHYCQIAENGASLYRSSIHDGEAFINRLLEILE
ncbi:glycosyltransferase family 1 protein [Pedobacter gandavensis]|uniref:glycosyltransferase family 1 protein n=1 Tax=Pedobacter gandavensis TaxID=2679963 RepID=UPI002930DFCF|nr:glycosyltransferase family 1 protein [Pedobacter gandavensis]